MAIVIPSKHIYSKTFDPVIDNNISKVEITAMECSEQINYRARVYDNDFNSIGLFEEDDYNLKADNKSVHSQPATQPEMYYYAEAISWVNIRPIWTTISIKIPRRQEKTYIKKVYDEKDISYSLTFSQKETVPITIKVNISSSDGMPTNSNISYNKLAIMDWNNRKSEEIKESIELKDFLSITNSVTVTEANGTPVQGVSTTASKTLINQENILTAKATLDLQDDSWNLLDLKFLTAVYYERAGYKQYYSGSLPILTTQTRNLSGEGVIYRAQQLSVTIYGDTLVLNLQDNTLKIGEGNKVFSFDGNELIQTTNTPSIESKYQSVIDHWKNGKQTAVISCPITDYFDEEGNKVIDITTNSKMLFAEGDIVIPYAYANKGDKPLSYNKDFMPKQFKVIGTKISKSQGGMQELTLQEV